MIMIISIMLQFQFRYERFLENFPKGNRIWLFPGSVGGLDYFSRSFMSDINWLDNLKDKSLMGTNGK